MFFMLSLYMQQVLGLSALQTGAGYLAVALTAIVSAGVAQALVTKAGVKPVMIVGVTLMGLGNLWFTQVSADGSYAVDLLPGFLAIGVGLGFSFVPMSIAALAGVDAAGSRPRVRPLQHLAADRRRARRRPLLDRRDQPDVRSARRGRVAGCGADERLHARLLGRCRLRRRWRWSRR